MRMRWSTTRFGYALAAAGLALFLGLTAAATPARAQGADTVRSLYATLLDVMRNGPALGPRGRYARIAPVIGQLFDMPYMTRLAVGTSWDGLGQTQQQQLVQAFERYIAAVYAERFDTYEGEQLQVTGEQNSSGGPIVLSQIIKSTGEPVHINYLMHQSGGGWQIADIYLNGTISELATRRSEFGSILRSQGVDGLIATLNAKAAALGA
jgi:phospholipid transport system substrate-binding protein